MNHTFPIYGLICIYCIINPSPFFGQSENTLQVSYDSLTQVSRGKVNIGYGFQNKEDVAGPLYKTDKEDFNKGMIYTPEELILGKIPGLSISSRDGTPGGNYTIINRGVGSFSFNDMLIVVDDVPLIGSSINMNPKDIENITILKDATVAGIFGTKASNGVIIITTKRGGKLFKVEYNGQYGNSYVPKMMDVYSGDQFRQLASSLVYLNGVQSLNVLGTQNTNWQKEIYHVAFGQDHMLSAAGSLANIPYRVSLGIVNQDWVLINSIFNRNTLSVALDPKFFNEQLQIHINFKGMVNQNKPGETGAIGNAIHLDPTQPVYQQGVTSYAGYWQWQNPINGGFSLGTPNPVEQLMAADNLTNITKSIGNILFDYQIPLIPELHANLNLALVNTTNSGHDNLPASAPTILTGSPTGKLDNFDTTAYSTYFEFYVNYGKLISQAHSRIDITAGYSRQHIKYTESDYDRSIGNVSNPVLVFNNVSSFSENYLLSYFGRLNYAFMDRYLLSLALCKDGSSTLAPSNSWKTFPAVAVAWKINKEPFLKDVKTLTELKIRLGWGETGRDEVSNSIIYAYSFITSSQVNWETTTTGTIGLDFGILNNRISGSFTLYNRVSDNLIDGVPILSGYPLSFTNEYFNVGSIQNKGYEISLHLVPVLHKEMRFTIGFNLAYNQNRITKLGLSNNQNLTIQAGEVGLSALYLELEKVGNPVNSFFMNKQIYNAQGQPIEGVYTDLSGKGGNIYGNPADMYIDHNPSPDYIMGIWARFDWKNWDASASGRAELGNYVYNYPAASVSYNQLYMLGYWSNAPTFLSQTQFTTPQYASDYFVQNASFFKLDNVSAGYKFCNVYHQLTVRVNLSVQNVLVITPYKGQDPEQVTGIEMYGVPSPRIFSLGIGFEL